FLVFGFELVNYQFVTVRILHDRHPAYRTLDTFGSKRNVRLFEALDGSVKVFDFNSDAGAVFGWFPLIADAADGQRVGTNLVFDPNTLAKFTRNSERKHSFVNARARFMSVTGIPVNAIFFAFIFFLLPLSRPSARHRPNRRLQ